MNEEQEEKNQIVHPEKEENKQASHRDRCEICEGTGQVAVHEES